MISSAAEPAMIMAARLSDRKTSAYDLDYRREATGPFSPRHLKASHLTSFEGRTVWAPGRSSLATRGGSTPNSGGPSGDSHGATSLSDTPIMRFFYAFSKSINRLSCCFMVQ